MARLAISTSTRFLPLAAAGHGSHSVQVLRANLETILGAKVDLVAASDLKPAVRARGERELVPL